MSEKPPLKLLIADDEPLARERLKTLLADIALQCPTQVLFEAANGQEVLDAWANLREKGEQVDVVLADIRMPGMDGLKLSAQFNRHTDAPALIFTTAYDNYALQAFDLNALDYLLKPVRAQRLLAALQKARPTASPSIPTAEKNTARRQLSCIERGKILIVPVAEVRYFKADLKYVIAHTANREYALDESLNQLEGEFSENFLRIHRAVLVARHAIIGCERAQGEDAEAYGFVLLRDSTEKLPVSRRLWSSVKQALLDV